MAGQFVAGETAAEALEYTRELNGRNVGAILNLLGEHYDERSAAAADTDAYCQLVDDIGVTDLEACISVKPSQLGLDVSESVFRENLARIVGQAADAGTFVWLDMEDHTTTDATLDAFEYHARKHGDRDRDGGVGVCLQANLDRTLDDLERVAGLPGKVRLVKGAYDPPPGVGYREKSRVNEAYRDCLEYAFAQFDGGVGVASHDPAMIDHARGLHQEYGTGFEIQMLMGVREEAQFALAESCPVWQYVPYGSRWLSYFYRRVTERTENLQFGLRAILNR